MRSLLFISLLICFGCNSTKNASTTVKKVNPLNGTWVPVRQEMAGNPMPKAYFEKQKLVLQDSTYILTAESVDKGVVRYSGDKMDIYGREGINTGKHFTAIYKYENGELTVCYNLSGKNYPEAFDTKGKQLYFLSVFKKE